MPKKKKDENTLSRSLVIPLNPESEEVLKITRAAIERQRAALRFMYSALATAEMTGASITETKDGDIRLKPNGPRGAMALTLAFSPSREVTAVKGKRGDGVLSSITVGAVPAYGLKDWFGQYWPSARSFVFDSARLDICHAWKAKDPEIPKTTRGWLTMQGARRLAQFMRRGIGFPSGTSPALRLGDHTVSAIWDAEIGPVNYTFGTLEPRQFAVVRKLLDPDSGYKVGTCYLNMDDKRDLRVIVTYNLPASFKDLDPGRVCCVSLDTEPAKFEDWAWVVHRENELPDPNGLMGFANLSSLLKQLEVRQAAIKERRRNCGNPKRPWGHKKGWLANKNVGARATNQRTGVVTDFNHVWTRRFVDRAVSWRCGTLELRGNCYAEKIGPYPWNWFQFKTMLQYKCQEVGIKLILPEKEKAEAK